MQIRINIVQLQYQIIVNILSSIACAHDSYDIQIKQTIDFESYGIRLRNNYDQVFCWVHVQSITIALSLLLSWLAWHSGININDAQPVSKIAFQTISLRSLMYFIVRFCIIIKTNKKK